MWQINRHPVEIGNDHATDIISDTKAWLNSIEDWDDPNDSNQDCAAEGEWDM